MKKVIAVLLVALASAALLAAFTTKAQARGGPYQYIIHVHATFPNGSSAPSASATVYDSAGGVGCTTDGSGNCAVYLNESSPNLTFRVTASKCGWPGVAHTFYYSGSYYTPGGTYQPSVTVTMYNTVSNGC